MAKAIRSNATVKVSAIINFYAERAAQLWAEGETETAEHEILDGAELLEALEVVSYLGAGEDVIKDAAAPLFVKQMLNK